MIVRLDDLLPPRKKESPYFPVVLDDVVFIADISCLSDDLLLFIFQALFRSIGGDESKYHYVALGVLRTVSRKWDSLLCFHSEFWGRLGFDQDPSAWDMVLRRNLNGPINAYAVLEGKVGLIQNFGLVVKRIYNLN